MVFEWYLERLSSQNVSFNLWEKEGTNYFNIATLFYRDPSVEDQWVIESKVNALKYSEHELMDELESPLKIIPEEQALNLLNLKNIEDVVNFIPPLLNN